MIVLDSFLQDNEQYKIGDTIRLPQGKRTGIQSGMPVEYEDQGRLNQEEVSKKRRGLVLYHCGHFFPAGTEPERRRL